MNVFVHYCDSAIISLITKMMSSMQTQQSQKNLVQAFPERWVRAVCVHIYGHKIADRTWFKYKKICRVPDSRKKENPKGLIPKTNCLWLMCFCWMKSQELMKYQERNFVRDAFKKQAIAYGCNRGITLTEVIRELNSPVKLANGMTRVQALEQALGDEIVIDGILGEDVPLWLKNRTGRSVSMRTLYVKAKQQNKPFSKHKPVPVETLDYFLDLYL